LWNMCIILSAFKVNLEALENFESYLEAFEARLEAFKCFQGIHESFESF
jgi:hypothetical protein